MMAQTHLTYCLRFTPAQEAVSLSAWQLAVLRTPGLSVGMHPCTMLLDVMGGLVGLCDSATNARHIQPCWRGRTGEPDKYQSGPALYEPHMMSGYGGLRIPISVSKGGQVSMLAWI